MSILSHPLDLFDDGTVVPLDSIDAVAWIDRGRTSVLFSDRVSDAARAELAPHLFVALGDPTCGALALVVPRDSAERMVAAPFVDDRDGGEVA